MDAGGMADLHAPSAGFSPIRLLALPNGLSGIAIRVFLNRMDFSVQYPWWLCQLLTQSKKSCSKNKK
jgi:hypothetical protein